MCAYPVRLYRNSCLTSWGFRLQGGADLHTPIIVQRVFAGSPAEGQLQRGDILTGIENYDATCMLHSEAQELIRSSGNTISLNVKRPQGGRVTRGQSVGPLGRQLAAAGSSFQQNQLFHQPQHEYKLQHHQAQQQQPVRQHRQDQYNVYVGGQNQRQRSESAAQYDGWQRQQQQQQQRNTISVAAYDGYLARDEMHHHHQSHHQPHHQTHHQPHHQAHHQPHHQAHHQPQKQQSHYQQQHQPQLSQQQLPSQRSIDDEDVDYSFSKQSVAERMRRFMQQANNSQSTSAYHSVPRSGFASAPSAANRYRQKQPFWSNGGVHRNPLGDLGWSPSPEKFHTASGRPTPSRAAFEQSSYLPSQGIGRADSPIRTRSTGRGGGNANQRHSVSGAFSGPRYSSMTQIGNGSAVSNSGAPGSEPFAYNSRQYNTPINMYSRQNISNAFEGQTGIQLRNQPGRNAGPGQEPAAFTQSLVYKMVHEQDQQQVQQKRNPHSWAPTNRQESEMDEPGVSEF